MKKTTSIAIIIVCLLGAGFSFYKYVVAPASGGLSGIPAKDITWVKCKNCGAEYQMKMRDYVQAVNENRDPKMVIATPGIPCKECGKNTLYLAIKCPNCGTVFIKNSIPGDLEDRCPKCRYSQQEELRKSRKAAN